ncbi:MAG: hypothetical protein HYV60_08675, partial [Planctomycetia bacterium]|nr:hypothetical protein [Planctomycetia bacterium]
AVSGTVKLNGQNLDQGTIAFHPEGNQGSLGGASIENGTYSIPAKQGLLVGKYKVSISSPEGGALGAVELPGESDVVVKERIPEKYNAKTELVAEVTAGGENEFDFDLQ